MRGALLAGLLLSLGCHAPSTAAQEVAAAVPVASPEARETGDDASAHAVAVRRLRRDARRSTLVAENNGRSAIAFTRAASVHMTLARLAAEPERWSDAAHLLDRAVALAPEDPPRLVLAQLHAALHRPRDAMAELEAYGARSHPGETPHRVAYRRAFQAQLALELGEYALAQVHLEASLGITETATGLATLARTRWLRADFDGAVDAYRRAADAYGESNRASRAWVKLQLGLIALERGRLDEAQRAYQAADALYPGYWLIEEHLAEVLALRGRHDEARERYVAVVEQAATPELLGALASVCATLGDEHCEEAALRRETDAAARWRRLLPGVADGHLVRRTIEQGSPRALVLALDNAEVRPNAEAWMLVAQAQLLARDNDAAVTSLGRALATPVRSAELHETAVAVYRATGDPGRVAEHRRAAASLDPTRRTRVELPTVSSQSAYATDSSARR